MKHLKTSIVISLLLLSTCNAYVNGQSQTAILKALPHMMHGYRVFPPQADYSNDMIALADLKEMDRRKYVVLQREPDAGVVKDLSNKPELVHAYKAGIDSINSNMKMVLTKFWTVCPENNLMYLTTAQFDAIADKQNYLVVFCYASSGYSSVSSYKLPLYKSNIQYSEKRMKGYLEENYDLQNQVFFAIEKPEDNTIVYSIAMPDMFPTKTDLVMAVTDLSNQYKVYKTFLPADIKAMDSVECWLTVAHKAHKADLAGKTLLIRKDWIGSSKLTEDDIKKLYPYPFKMVTSAELDEYVMNRTPGYVFYHVGVNIDIYNPNGMINTTLVYVGKSIINMENFQYLSSSGEAHNVLGIYLTKDDINKWVNDSHKKIVVDADAQKYPDYAGFLIPLKFSPKASAPNNVFYFKNTPLDSCLITIHDDTWDQKVVGKYYNNPTANWDGGAGNDGYWHGGKHHYTIKGIAGKNTYYEMRGELYMVNKD